MLIETHAHLDFPQYNNDRDDVITRAKACGIIAIINISSSLKGCYSSIELSRKYDLIYAACGIHPHDAKKATASAISQIEALIENNKKVVAIGEVGLDFYRNHSERDTQLDSFVKFIGLSKRFGLPLVLHCREESPDKTDAQELLFKAMEEHLEPPFKGVMHCFSGDEKLLARCIDNGLHVSFTCNVTFKKADRLRQVLSKVPIERLLLETDSPFLAPQAKRGQRNEPSYLSFLVEAISEALGMEKERIEEMTTHNARRLFLSGQEL
jgi:TatD DNase family protein